MKKIIQSRAHHSLFIAWLICSLAALFYTYEYMLRIEPGIMVADLRAYFGLTAGGLGLLASMYYWAYTPLQLVVGPVIDYFGARRVLICAILACVIGTFLFGFTHSYLFASGARFLVGAGSAFAFVGALKLAADWLPRRYFSFFTGCCVALAMVGAIFGETVMSWIIDHLGWHPVIADSVWLGAALIGVFSLFVYEKHEVTGRKQHAAPLNFTLLGKTLLGLMRERTILFAGWIGCCLYLSLSLFAEQWGNVYVQTAIGGNTQAASYYVDLIFFGWLVGSPLCGYLSELFKSRRIVLIISSLGSLIVILPVVIIPRYFSHDTFAVLMFLFGLFSSGQVNCFAVARDMVETRLAATAAGLMNTMVMLGGMLIQPFFAYCINWFSPVHRTILQGHVYSLAVFQKALIILPIFIFTALIAAWLMEDSYEIGEGGKWRDRIRL